MMAVNADLAGTTGLATVAKWKRVTLIVTPWVLLLTTYLVYQGAVRALGPQLGYLTGFLFYWFGWCFGLSFLILGLEGVLSLFRDRRPRFTSKRWLGVLLLLSPLLVAYGYEFPRVLSQATLPIVLTSALISLINGTAEELLWRGVYSRVFPDNLWWGYLYPAFGFAIWHFAPQSVFPSSRPGASLSLVAFALFLGLVWGWIAYRTQSVRWTTLAHIIFDFSGLGGRLYF
jgi:hypothetical protein